jgi:2,3-bisphosphoglycerate-independent phosphoglycerate mutase
VHFIGLVSDGGVHSHIDHLKGLCSIASEAGGRRIGAFLASWTAVETMTQKSGKGLSKTYSNI